MSDPDSGAAPAGDGLAFEDALATLVLVCILGVMAAGVFFRYVLNASLSWSEELARYGLVYVTFLGCATGFRRRSHIRIDLLDRVLPPRIARMQAILLDILAAVFLAYMAWLAWQLMGILHTQRSAAMRLPMSWVYLALLIGFSLALLRLVLAWYRLLRGRR